MSTFFGVRPPLSSLQPPDENTLLLLRGIESPLIDSSQNERSLTLHGGVARSSNQSKFSGYSIYFG